MFIYTVKTLTHSYVGYRLGGSLFYIAHVYCQPVLINSDSLGYLIDMHGEFPDCPFRVHNQYLIYLSAIKTAIEWLIEFKYLLGAHKLPILPFTTLRPRQDGRHFQDDTFERIFLNENVIILIKISLKFVPYGPIKIFQHRFR